MSYVRWNADDVLAWLDRIGKGTYRENFARNGVDGSTLQILQQADLKSELEIAILKDRKEIWEEIELLRHGTAAPTEPAKTVSHNPSTGTPPSISPAFHSASHPSHGYSPYKPTPSVPHSSPSKGDPALTCHRCNKPLLKNYISALNRNWHDECFRCAKCELQILDGKYASEDDRIYHPDCLAIMKGDICEKCYQPVLGSVTQAMGKRWHPECFTCAKCAGPIFDSNFVLNGTKAYHVRCDDATSTHTQPGAPAGGAPHITGGTPNTEICAKCFQLIKGITTTALGKSWHPECFVCGQCGKPIREDKFKTEGEVPMHLNCKSADEVKLCRGCWRQINEDQILTAMNELWHPQCFKCHVCKLVIADGRYVRDGLYPAHPGCVRQR